MKKVLILDTSVLCVYLQVPGMDVCGPDADRWDYDRIKKKLDEEQNVGTTFVLPLAVIIETGNHITHVKGQDPYDVAQKFLEIINKTADKATPWAAFVDQQGMWTGEGLRALGKRWVDHVSSGQSIGDASIVDVCQSIKR